MTSQIQELIKLDGTELLEDGSVKLTSSSSGDEFGSAVSISGNTFVIGASLGNGGTGCSYVYHWNDGSYEKIQLQASDGALYDYFGYSVSLDGGNIVIGSYMGDGEITDSGSAYVYRWNGEIYEEYKVTASDGAESDRFGYSVSVDGETVVIGAPESDTNGVDSGCAYGYHWNGTSYDEYKVTASDGGASDELGFAVSVSGYTAFVGAPWDVSEAASVALPEDGEIIPVESVTPYSGSLYAYRWNEDGTSFQEYKLTTSDSALVDISYGGSVASSDELVVVGAPGGDFQYGCVYVYHWNGESYDEYKLSASDRTDMDFLGGYGYSVAISGNNIVVGSPGSDISGVESSEVDSGSPVTPGTNAGCVYLYHWNGDSYDEYRITAADAQTNDYFGYSVSISGNTVVVGNDAGAAYVYDISALVGESVSTRLREQDFNGDGKSDILFSNGSSIGYFGGGESSAWVSLGDYSPDWRIVGSGDFDGDGKADIFFTNGTSSGYYSGGVTSAWTPGGDISSGWDVAGCGDFNGDGKSEVFFTNGTSSGYYSGGNPAVWTPGGDISSGWEVAGCGDFDGDGKSDVLFTNGTSSGYFSGGDPAGWTPGGDISSGWEVVGSGDFDGDGKSDVYCTTWNASGYFSGGDPAAWTSCGDICKGWSFAGSGDFDGNGKSDLIFTDGTSVGCFTDALQSGWTPLGEYASGWSIVTLA